MRVDDEVVVSGQDATAAPQPAGIAAADGASRPGAPVPLGERSSVAKGRAPAQGAVVEVLWQLSGAVVVSRFPH